MKYFTFYVEKMKVLLYELNYGKKMNFSIIFKCDVPVYQNLEPCQIF